MPARHIEFLRFVHLRGPSIWTYRPVLEALVDIGDLEDCPSDTIPGFPERLAALLPGLVEHRCSYGERGGFLRRLAEGTWPAHIMEHVTLELQNLAGMRGGFGRARSTSRRGIYKVAVRAWHEDITRTAFHQARDLLVAAMDGGHVRDAGAFPDAAAMDGEHAGRPGAASGPATKDYDALPFDVPAAVGVLRGMADALLLGPITQSIVDVATARDRRIPAIRLDAGKLVQLGYGVRGRRILVAGDARRAHAAVRQVQAQAAVERHVDGARREIAEIGVSVSEAGRGANRQGDAPAWVDAGYNLVGNVSSDGGIGPEATRVLVERLFPGGDSGRIPVIGVAGSHGTARVARLIAWLVGQDERRVGLACGQGLFLGPQRIDPGDCAHWAPARRLLCDPRVEVAVIENGMEAMLREGLAYDRCQVGVLTNIDPARLPDDGYVDRPERLCMLMRTQVDVVLPGGAAVLNATDPLAAEMASLSDGEVIFFSSDPDHPVVLGHCAAGGRAVTLAEQRVTLVQGSKAAEVFDLRVLTWVGGESCLIDGLLAAVAAAWAADLTPDRIRDGLAGFRAQELG